MKAFFFSFYNNQLASELSTVELTSPFPFFSNTFNFLSSNFSLVKLLFNFSSNFLNTVFPLSSLRSAHFPILSFFTHPFCPLDNIHRSHSLALNGSLSPHRLHPQFSVSSSDLVRCVTGLQSARLAGFGCGPARGAASLNTCSLYIHIIHMNQIRWVWLIESHILCNSMTA